MSNVSDRPENQFARSTLCQLPWISWRLKIFTRLECVFRNFKLFVIDISSFFGRLTFRSVRFLQHILNSSPHKNTSNQRMTRFGLNWSIRNWPAAVQMAQTALILKRRDVNKLIRSEQNTKYEFWLLRITVSAAPYFVSPNLILRDSFWSFWYLLLIFVVTIQ